MSKIIRMSDINKEVTGTVDEKVDAMIKGVYTDTMNKVHAPKELLGKVKGMKENDTVNKKRWTKKAWYVAAFIGVFGIISSNAITYAATGSTWVQKAIVYIDGEEREVELEEKVDEDGNKYYEANFDIDENAVKEVVVVKDEEAEEKSDAVQNSEKDDREEDTVSDINAKEAYVKEEAGRTYLIIGENWVDITEDIKDGRCEGTLDTDEGIYVYTIVNTEDGQSVSVELK